MMLFVAPKDSTLNFISLLFSMYFTMFKQFLNMQRNGEDFLPAFYMMSPDTWRVHFTGANSVAKHSCRGPVCRDRVRPREKGRHPLHRDLHERGPDLQRGEPTLDDQTGSGASGGVHQPQARTPARLHQRVDLAE